MNPEPKYTQWGVINAWTNLKVWASSCPFTLKDKQTHVPTPSAQVGQNTSRRLSDTKDAKKTPPSWVKRERGSVPLTASWTWKRCHIIRNPTTSWQTTRLTSCEASSCKQSNKDESQIENTNAPLYHAVTGKQLLGFQNKKSGKKTLHFDGMPWAASVFLLGHYKITLS